MLKQKLILLLIIIPLLAKSQIDEYYYSRQLSGISETRHKIELPVDIFDKAKPDLSDIRILGKMANSEILEAPYIIENEKEQIITKEYKLQLINQSQKNMRHFFTLKMLKEATVNRIQLSFRQVNYDWRIKLEASQNQNEWFTILTDYRILSIKNWNTDYQFNTLIFDDAQYLYYRISLTSIRNPGILDAQIKREEATAGSYNYFRPKYEKISLNKEKKQSIINFGLEGKRSVSSIHLYIASKFDYYRNYTVYSLDDSIETAKGYQKTNRILATGILSSLENNEIEFNSALFKQCTIIISNNDNQPLTIDSISIKGNKYSLIARFTEKADYFLAYGNPAMESPEYDITNFSNTIPDDLQSLTLGVETTNKEKINSQWPLNVSKNWLWVVMIFIIVLLGWFSISLMRKKEE
jgi:hypothetical protein